MTFRRFAKTQIFLIIIAAICLVVATTGLSYAIWNQVNESGTQTVQTGNLNVSFSTGATLTANLVRTTDAAGLASTPFTLTVNNTSSSLPTDYVIRVHNTSGITNPLEHRYLKISVDGAAGVFLNALPKEYATNNENDTIYILKNTSIAKGTQTTHNIRIWLVNDAPTSTVGKNVNLTVEVEAVVSEDICTLYPNTLTCKILANNGGQSTIKAKASPDFSTSTGTGMYSMLDETGKTSYYFRGAKTTLNNNVIFGGHQWKIVRINGDGHIKLIYNGTCTNDVCTIIDVDVATQVSTSAFNATSTNIKYVGYTYDTNTDSTIKIANENWYASKMLTYDDYIADIVYCNDKTSRVEGATTYFGSYDRNSLNKTPSLICSQDADKYTKESTKGNKLLKQKVGMLTGDEANIAGSVSNTSNTGLYLNGGNTYWLMDPYYYNGTNSYNVMFHTNAYYTYGNSNQNFGLRPVIALASNVKWASGNGSTTTPYKITYDR